MEYDAEQSVIHSCGQPIDESSNSENWPAYTVERYECGACAALEAARKNDHDKPVPGRGYRVKRRQ